jgi:hypothetical protein
MTSKEFRAGILHAAQMLRDEAAASSPISDGARRLCLTDMAEKLDAEARRRDLKPRSTQDGGGQLGMF